MDSRWSPPNPPGLPGVHLEYVEQGKVLDASNRILGVEHPQTINAMANLVGTYKKLGRYEQAEKLEIQVLNARNRILGVEHPDTIKAMANLALTYQKLGKYTEAEQLQMQVSNTKIGILGVKHPHPE